MAIPDEHIKFEIISSFRELLQQDIPLRKISVGQLMDELGRSEEPFYRHFTDVNEILIPLLLELEAGSKHRSVAWYETDDRPPSMRLEDSIRDRVDYIQPHAKVLKAIIEAAGQNDTVNLMWNKLLDYYISKTCQNIEAQQAGGEIRQELDARAAATYLTRGNTQIYITYFGQEQQASKEDVSRMLIQIWTSVLYLDG